MKKLLLLATGLLLVALIADAQSLMENNWAAERAKLGVKSETVRHALPTGDTCLASAKEFDPAGLITKNTEYHKCNSRSVEYLYKYNEDGSLRKAYIRHHSSSFQQIEMGMPKDEKGRVKELAPSKQIKDFPYAHRFEYNEEGQIVKLIRLRQELFSYVIDSTIEWDPNVDYSIISSEEEFDEDGTMKWVVLREFEYY